MRHRCRSDDRQMTRDLRTYSGGCSFSNSVSNSHLRCPLDVQLDINMRRAEVSELTAIGIARSDSADIIPQRRRG
jgi:hypothetical protein